MGTVAEIPALLTEAEAYARYAEVLEDKELRRAREARAIGYYKRKGKILYREDELAAFVRERLEGSYVAPCLKNPCSESDRIGGVTSPAHGTSTVSGMTPDLEKSAASLLRQQILRKPSDKPPRGGSRKAKLRLVSPTT